MFVGTTFLVCICAKHGVIDQSKSYPNANKYDSFDALSYFHIIKQEFETIQDDKKKTCQLVNFGRNNKAKFTKISI